MIPADVLLHDSISMAKQLLLNAGYTFDAGEYRNSDPGPCSNAIGENCNYSYTQFQSLQTKWC